MTAENDLPMTLEFMNRQLEEKARQARNTAVVTGVFSMICATASALETFDVIDMLPNNAGMHTLTSIGAAILGANAVLKFHRSYQLHQGMNEAQQQLEEYKNG